jgi:hypothetical protein
MTDPRTKRIRDLTAANEWLVADCLAMANGINASSLRKCSDLDFDVWVRVELTAIKTARRFVGLDIKKGRK